mmetsp:Transcript_110408/g.216498  ORF Transcript_110408/g.216498 Transcript_110408/m.216498 type:complete len:123 (+) Transcript_110408:765-1133(+)
MRLSIKHLGIISQHFLVGFMRRRPFCLTWIIPQGAGWPAAYDYFWKNEFSKPQIRTNRELSEEDKINRFGKLVHDTYRTSKSFIAANLVLLYQKHIDRLSVPSITNKITTTVRYQSSLLIIQ